MEGGVEHDGRVEQKTATGRRRDDDTAADADGFVEDDGGMEELEDYEAILQELFSGRRHEIDTENALYFFKQVRGVCECVYVCV